MDKFITKNNEETIELGERFAKSLEPGQVVFLYGDLGAGKTTFVQGVARGLGIKDRIISPTFILHRVHKVSVNRIKEVNHLDLYRLENKINIKELGLNEVFEDKDSIAFVEWADRIGDLPDFEGYKIYFKHLGDNKREILIEENLLRQVEKAVKVLKTGGIVIYPTDTAFGIGCRIDSEESVKRLFEIRKRSEKKATPVLFDSIEKVSQFVLPFDSKVKKLMEKHWPGALTIVLPCQNSKVPSLVRGGGNNLGVRIPDHIVPRQLIRSIGVPIIGASANFSGNTTPFSFEKLDKRLIKLVDFVIEGQTNGDGLTSTVVDCSALPWKIIRQGSVVI